MADESAAAVVETTTAGDAAPSADTLIVNGATTTDAVDANGGENAAAKREAEERKVFDNIQRRAARAEEKADDSAEATDAAAAERTQETAKPDTSRLDTALKTPAVVSLLGKLSVNPADALEKAIEGLNRLGESEEEIQELYDRDPARFLEKGLTRYKAAMDQDQFGREYKAWREAGDGTGKGGRQQPTAQETRATPANPATAVNPLQEVDAALAPLSDIAGPEGVAAIRNAIVAAFRQAVNHTQSVAGRSQMVESEIVEMRLGNARSGLRQDYPELAEDSTWQSVLENGYDVLAATGRFKTPEECLREAVRWKLGDRSKSTTNEQIAKLKESLLNKNRQRAMGTPRTRTNGTAAVITRDDRERQAFEKARRKHGLSV